MSEPLYVTISKAVQVSGLSRTGLYSALRRKELTARKAGKRTLLEYEALKAYLNGLPAFSGEV